MTAPTTGDEDETNESSCQNCGHQVRVHRETGGCHFSGTARSCRCAFSRASVEADR